MIYSKRQETDGDIIFSSCVTSMRVHQFLCVILDASFNS